MGTPHRQWLHLPSHGPRQWLQHSGTGEVRELPPNSAFGLIFNNDGWGFLAAGQQGRDVRDLVAVAPRARVSKEFVKARVYLKHTLHADANGKLFVMRSGRA